MKGERRMTMKQKAARALKYWEVYLMLLPPLAYLLIFHYLPMAGVSIAFKDFSLKRGILGSEWAGLKYFKEFMTTPLFWQLLSNTLKISLYNLVASFPIPILLALCLNEISAGRYKNIVQTVTYAPYFISTVVLVGMMMQFLHVHNGFVNNLLTACGIPAVNFMGEPGMFRSLYVWSGIWQTAGYSAIIYIAALSGVDPSLVEASVIDGANRFQKILHVDLPGIAPTIIILLIMETGRLFTIGFEKIYLMQNPLNLDQSEIISTFVYKRGLQGAQYSYATAVGVFNSAVNLVMITLSNAISRKVSDTSLW